MFLELLSNFEELTRGANIFEENGYECLNQILFCASFGHIKLNLLGHFTLDVIS